MRVLASTFQQGDLEKVLEAMRSLSYDRLVLIGMPGADECEDLKQIHRLEEMAGHTVEVVIADRSDFMGIVSQVASLLEERFDGSAGPQKDSIVINISGGSKLLGDAALLAAFGLGVEAYHIDGKVVRLPVIKGARARDRYTESQTRMLECIGQGEVTLDGLAKSMEPMSRQGVDRVIRELKREKLIESRIDNRKVVLRLSQPGLEVLRALRLAKAG